MINNLSSQSLEQLEKSKKTIQLITILLSSMLILLLFTSLYITFTQKFTSLLVMPFALSPIVFLNVSNLKKINKEIASRK